MISPRKNYIRAVVDHKIPEWVPNGLTDVISVGGPSETFDNGPTGGGPDGFGVEWTGTESAGGQAVPVPGKYVLTDVTKWKGTVSFPDVDAFDWEAAAQQLDGADRTAKVVEYGCWNAQFLRLTHLMGFENALMALYEEPEACYDLMDAITDYKIKVVEKVAQYIKPDFFTSFDDVATERGLFMSPETYRTLIKPHHKRVNEAVKAHGMHPIIHCCGKCEEIIPDFIDEGAVAWSSAQPSNDIAGILKQYGDRLAVIGGYDSNGYPGTPMATEEDVDREVRRVIETYGPYGSFVFFGFRLVDSEEAVSFEDTLRPILVAAEKYSK